MPTHFRWLWYLIGLTGMSLAVVGLLAMIGSIVNDGLILPVLGLAAVGLGYVLLRNRRRPRQTAAVEATTGTVEAASDSEAAPAEGSGDAAREAGRPERR